MKKIVFYITFILIVLVSTSPTLAVNKIAQAQQKVGIGKTLGGPNLASCLARQNTIKNRMTSLMTVTTNVEKQIDVISQKTVDYYNDTIVPSGKTLPNYNSLISNIQTKKDMIQAAFSTAQTDSNNFNCSSGDPKLLLAQYRLNMQTVKRSLREYRTAVKTLVTAVKAVSPVKNVETN